MRKAFTLVEMLVVIGIIGILIGASIGGYAHVTKSAEKTKAKELVANTATALAALFQAEGSWPQRLINGGGRLDARAALALAKGKYMSLSTTGSGKSLALSGLDRFGVVTPWAMAALKRAGSSGDLSTRVPGTKTTVQDHILYYALDLDGNGVIEGSEITGISGVERIRATAAVWCIGKDGGNNGKPWEYERGLKKGDIYSWSYGQTRQ